MSTPSGDVETKQEDGQTSGPYSKIAADHIRQLGEVNQVWKKQSQAAL
jgi:hypothetical protein